jgi:hypothetical protein
MPRKITPEPPKSPDSPEELAKLAFDVYEVALKAGDCASALRALRTYGELSGFLGAEPRRRSKSEKASGIDAEIKSLEKRLGFSSGS